MTSRTWLTAGTLLLAGVVYLLMLKGWRSRQRRQADVPAPPLPTGRGRVVVAGVSGLFVGTTDAADWLDRMAVHRLSDRASGDLTVADDGVHIVRDELPELFVPLGSIEDVTIETALAGKVVSSGMLVLTWRLGARTLASAFRADDPAAHPRLRDAITALLPVEAT
ncbi:MAG: transporter [Mycobacteriales bacterium]